VRGSAKQYFFHGDVFIAHDRIVASSDTDPRNGTEAGIHAFDRDSGRELWKHAAGRGVLGAIMGAGPRVFAYGSNGELIALNIATGKPAWTQALKESARESPAVAGARVFAGSSDGLVYALTDDTGRVEWQARLGSSVSTSIRTINSDVYAGTADHTLYRLDADKGTVRSSMKIDSSLVPTAAPLVNEDAVIVLLADQQANYRSMVSLDPSLARTKWRRDAGDRWTTSRVFATERAVWVGTPSGEITAYCLADGSPGWSHKLTSAPIRSIGGSDQALYVGTPAGTLYAIRPPQVCR
jgi:outer membrane protein assembly factor BamB